MAYKSWMKTCDADPEANESEIGPRMQHQTRDAKDALIANG